MSKGEIAQKAPYGVTLKPGTYFWCACGKSGNQPFCDASHKGTDITPVKFTITEEKEYRVCGCKQTKNQPFCDGTHNKI